MDPAQLAQLGVRRPRVVVDAVNASPSGGQPGSNPRAVELTLALHRSFHSPHDVIPWDTGHRPTSSQPLPSPMQGFSTSARPAYISIPPSRVESGTRPDRRTP
ncbi:MAG: 1-deoxy-D-xylulose-5-phosphate synthase, partial [Candidatus Microthrix sp.]|nr:1-deoxy-D-xylulose-5-phosphate synthase [Candidatus Microthrix sp.]